MDIGAHWYRLVAHRCNMQGIREVLYRGGGVGGQRPNLPKFCPKIPFFGLIAIFSTKSVTDLGLGPKKSFISPPLSAHTCTPLHREKNNSILSLGTAAHSLTLSFTSQKIDYYCGWEP